MDIDVLVIWFLFSLIGFLIIICIKIIINSLFLNKLVDRNYETLSNHLHIEMESFEKNKEKIELVDQLHQTLFNRLFQITRELLVFQKMMLNKNIG